MLSWAEIRKSQEMHRRARMEKQSQPFLDNFLKAEAEARESLIDETTRQLHLARQFCRFEKAQKICHNEHMKKMLERCKRETIKLMER